MRGESSGVDLAEAFYVEAVRPIVDRVCPGLCHSAARIGRGSEVLGFDDQVSRDHDWCPRLELFIGATDVADAEMLKEALADQLPRSFAGYSISFGLDANGVSILVEVGDAEPGSPPSPDPPAG
jgi:hypothetical protein